MKKRIMSLLMSLALLFSVACPVAFADDITTHTHTWVDTGTSFSDTIEGLPISIKVQSCTGCMWYNHTATVLGIKFSYPSIHLLGPLDQELIDALTSFVVKIYGKNSKFLDYATGGGSADGSSGVGRRPAGYTDNDTPNVTQAGALHFYAPVTGWAISSASNASGLAARGYTPNYEIVSANATGSKFPTNYATSGYVEVLCEFTAPVSGTYSVGAGQLVAEYNYLYNNKWLNLELKSTTKSGAYFAGDKGFYYRSTTMSSLFIPFDAKGYGVDIYVTPTTNTINQTNNITINNNTWNGNIYQDNSTNLTYIYPQYTTINENNETVTNISENPIIYNNTTNEYYTYDTVTNNYYYITYETTTPTPTPNPDPTPTPTPGGNTGDTGDSSGILSVLVEIRDKMVQGFADIKATLVQGWADLSANFTLAIENLNLNITNIFNKKFPDQSTPETAEPSPSPSPSPEPSPSPTPDPGETPTPTPAPTDKPNNGNTNNFWNFVFPGGSDDGTENGHKGILWALISLLIAVVTFVLGLGSAYAYVFPFLPAGLVATIHICVLVLLLFAIIKFVRSFL